MLLPVVFCLFFNRISSEKSNLLDNKLAKNLHFWTPGQCNLPNTSVDISSGLTGEWYYRATIQLFPVEETINPFVAMYFNYNCLKFIMNYNSDIKELEIEYSCRKPLFKVPEECQVFVKFGQNNRIIYPATNCPKASKLKNVMIAYTDYLNYLVIVGCQEAWTSSQTIMHQNMHLVLSRSVGELTPEIEEEISRSFDSSITFYILPDAKAKLTCTCEDFTCEAIQKGCYPVRSQKIESNRKLSLNEITNSQIIFLLTALVLFILIVISLIMGCSKDKIGAA